MLSGLLRQLEHLADLLTNIQKALGLYLERKRAAFPRFYFVGDEDLLEIIGNAKDPLKIQRHMNKMFAGIVALEMTGGATSDDDGEVKSKVEGADEQEVKVSFHLHEVYGVRRLVSACFSSLHLVAPSSPSSPTCTYLHLLAPTCT